MPGTPDFAAIATRLIGLPVLIPDDTLAVVVGELIQIWNARGAADLAAVDEVAHTNRAAVAKAIRDVDR